MASLAAVCRSSARLARGRSASARAFTTSARCLAAQNFTMPALSPTMTEGNIASWNVKEGDSFMAGDVLLEIETDKATMDVEAQEDGIMMKIMAGDGSKSVQVGTRIAVLAEAGDDISTLELPADEQPQKSTPSQESALSQDSKPEPSQTKSASKASTSSGTYEHKHPLLPSVEHLVKQHGVSEGELKKIKGTGPGGRLLKGDVLAYLGTIKEETPGSLSAMWDKLSHLDLSNIKVAEKKRATQKKAEPVEEEEEAVPEALEINMPVSLAKVVETQRKIQESLGVFLPLSTFIGRAAEVANDDLPLAARPPTSSELFDQVLGLDKVKAAKGSRGVYLPQISAIPPMSMLAPPHQPKRADIIDILSAPAKKPRVEHAIPVVPGLSKGDNVFSLVVPKAEEERAYVFLERCKAILEQEPGRLVL